MTQLEVIPLDRRRKRIRKVGEFAFLAALCGMGTVGMCMHIVPLMIGWLVLFLLYLWW